MARIAAWIALVLALSALSFAARAEEFTTKDGRPVRNVAVVSRLGDQITLYYAQPSIPITVWEGHERPFLMPEFAIDARIERTIAAAIAPRFTVVAIDPGVADNNYTTWNERSLQEKIVRLPPRPDIDAYIVVCQDKQSIEMGAFLTTRGLVLYRRWRPLDDVTGLLGFYRLTVVDARTGETIAGREGGIDSDIFHTSIPRRDIDDSFWPGEEALPSGDQVPRLRDEFYKFVDESILWTLRRMELTP